jgi:hypothetical protein
MRLRSLANKVNKQRKKNNRPFRFLFHTESGRTPSIDTDTLHQELTSTLSPYAELNSLIISDQAGAKPSGGPLSKRSVVDPDPSTVRLSRALVKWWMTCSMLSSLAPSTRTWYARTKVRCTLKRHARPEVGANKQAKHERMYERTTKREKKRRRLP